jgi:hypothetical protein
MKLLELNEAVFRERYDRQPFDLRHRLCGHPAFDPKSLRALALRLPRGDVLHRHGSVPIDADFDGTHLTHANGLSLEETFDRLQEVNGYIVLNHPERDALFRELVDEMMAELRALDGGIYWFATYIFISSGGSVTPYHMDRELNFLLQVRGHKSVSLWDPADRSVMSELDRERLFTDFNAPRPPWRDALLATEQRFEIGPGDGVHHPFIAPHVVRTGEQPSVSWAVTFRTHRTDDRAAVHKVNRWLRKLGLEPTPQGMSPALDLMKSLGMRLYRTVTRPGDRLSPYLLPHAPAPAPAAMS